MRRSATTPRAGIGTTESGPGGWTFWVAFAVGAAVMAFAARGILQDAGATNPPGLARWLIGGLLVHDLVVAPITTAVAIGLHRWAPAWWRGPVMVTLAGTAVLVLFSWPLLRGYGRRPANLSALPHDYGRTVAMLLIGGWSVTAAVVAVRAVRRRVEARSTEGPA
jgi:hypothetical protein